MSSHMPTDRGKFDFSCHDPFKTRHCSQNVILFYQALVNFEMLGYFAFINCPLSH